jgi:5-methylthioribose kinase
MELNIEDFDALRKHLAKTVCGREPSDIATLPGGVSNRTVRVTWSDGQAWVLKQALEKLRVKEDWFSSPDRIHVEAKALRWLNRLAPAGMTPDFLFEDVPNHLLAMEAVPRGYENWKSMLLSGHIVPNYFEQFGFLLGTVHRKSSEAGPELSHTFADTRYFESLRLDPYYGYAARKAATAAGFLTTLSRETLRHKLSLVHGDFSPKNVLIYQDKLILLDYEVVHFGDPAFDLGFALTHFLSKANHLPSHRAAFGDAAVLFWQSYTGEVAPLHWEGVESRAARHTLACLLARVLGKSPLEYLTSDEAARQRDLVIKFMARPPVHVRDLIAKFLRQIETYGEN